MIVSMTTDSLGLGGGRGGVHRVDTGGVRAGQRRGGEPCPGPGPVIVSLKFFSVWAYVLGPVVGGVLGAVVYDEFIGPATATAADENRPAVRTGVS